MDCNLLGLTIAGDEARPVGLEDLRAVLKRRNQLELEERLGGDMLEAGLVLGGDGSSRKMGPG
ncbi:hypothetical protein [Candidatus Synechococcus spongiarum]|uniref:Uncharacterized protein n=1 Tax=Candidatus Synechococcus spongiarum TaxID=431041 RepID=A0A165B1R3_9SYNE|nr:hypothetical protein [Candidatus Synechococcus spongiarum]SAY38352.1 hypothetical protein FLM9_210 [Candidatus Synechococcus spongiarum]